jgi:hypothetical protein
LLTEEKELEEILGEIEELAAEASRWELSYEAADKS